MDARFGTHVTLKVGDRAVDVLTGHLTLFGQGQNTEQMAQLHDLSASLQKQGHTVVLTGDWNTNMAAVEPESTLGHPTAGNTASPANRAAIQRLMGDMNYYWDAPNRTVLVDGTLMTPEQARAELQSGKVDPKSERYRQLEQAADGSTVLSAYKRFDNVFTSKDARIESAFIDQTTRASDHQPVVTDIRWD
jgi:endonuclease/exonuclease/phosphatase family metal-dependent hydrolase